MPNILREVAILQREGKLHRRLVSRTRMFLIISAALFCVAAYFVAVHGANPLACIALAILGYVLGYFIFSRITPVQWNADSEQVESGSLGILGWSAIGLYIIFEIGMRTLLSEYAGASAEGYVLASIFGLLLGRSLGVIVHIHRAYIATHAE